MRGALLFDIDGTLADTDAIHMEAFNTVLGPYGHSFDRVRYTAELQGFANLSISARFLPGLTPEAALEVMRGKEATFRELVKDMIHPVAGLLALMERADLAGVPMVAVTNAPRLNAELLLGGIGITDRFVAVVIGEELAHGKPHPLPYLEGLRLAGADPALSVAFEDSRSGITSATTAGLPVYGIRTSFSPQQMAEAGAVGSADDFTDAGLLTFVEGRVPGLRR